mmetsp:Transcript_2413/g.4479  ORF Transcript_2413/g.4479 Transcript_2413/m.4479 type:complete len:555 (+) Transcript_2413:2636-4300(+)|eukprot:CAMPEP_0176499234 /NCGR_PEP_ID=MMETSP0200_2-20121128/12809_1 /TAXON_ID=947934 /ORGANISM="Chaetoceros sp., Strain GSL56" /LENGTH=554 /DNA_ID=CAMNT_0017897621 /DNA_START=1400 /DNA_END=3064 /DNA_ORIENTATION=-
MSAIAKSTTNESNEDDFVHILSAREIGAVSQSTVATELPSTLDVKVTPRHDIIGTKSSLESTEFCTTVTARELVAPEPATALKTNPHDDNEAAVATGRAPVDIVVALDISGSMNGRKLDLCKDTLCLLLRELSSQDRFGLVVFGDEARLEIPTRKLTKETKEAALSRIKSLGTDGCTNMSGGIGLAAQELHAVESPHQVRAIFLLTDGLANVGISDREGILALTKGCLGSSQYNQHDLEEGTTGSTVARPSSSEIVIHCFGYGVDHDREMLGAISKVTQGGTYYFVDKDSDVSSAFGDALGGVLSVVAQNATIQIKVPPESSALGVAITNVKHDKAVKQQEIDGSSSYHIPLGDFYAEESRDVIVETTLSRGAGGASNGDDGAPAAVQHIVVNVVYLDTIRRKLARSPDTFGCISRSNNSDFVSKTNAHVALQCIRIKTTQILNETAVSISQNGDLAKARSKIHDFIKQVQQEAQHLELTSNPLIVQLLNELNTALSGLASHAEYQAVGAKYIQTRCEQHSMQRCAEANEEVANMYRSSNKMQMAKRMKTLSKK